MARAGGADGWQSFAEDTAAELKERLGVARYLGLGERDRERVARRLRDAIDSALEVPPDLTQRVTAEMAALRPGPEQPEERWDPVAHAWARTRARARRSAAIGTVTTIPAMIPVLGPALAALGLVADWRLVAEQQRDLVLEIAALFDAMPADPTDEVRGLFLASAGSALVGTQVGDAVARAASHAATRAATRAAAAQTAKRAFTRLVPGVGAAVAGALNYAATVALGRAAIHRFAEAAGLEVRGVVPRMVHPAMSRLRRRVLTAVAAEEAKPLTGPDAERAVFLPEDAEAVAQLTTSERDELLDLAVAAALEGGTLPHEEAGLNAVAHALGFADAELAESRASMEREMMSFRERFEGVVGRVRGAGRTAAGRLWRAARSLGRRGE